MVILPGLTTVSVFVSQHTTHLFECEFLKEKFIILGLNVPGGGPDSSCA